jgi:hypothetical protein
MRANLSSKVTDAMPRQQDTGTRVLSTCAYILLHEKKQGKCPGIPTLIRLSASTCGGQRSAYTAKTRLVNMNGKPLRASKHTNLHKPDKEGFAAAAARARRHMASIFSYSRLSRERCGETCLDEKIGRTRTRCFWARHQASSRSCRYITRSRHVRVRSM